MGKKFISLVVGLAVLWAPILPCLAQAHMSMPPAMPMHQFSNSSSSGSSSSSAPVNHHNWSATPTGQSSGNSSSAGSGSTSSGSTHTNNQASNSAPSTPVHHVNVWASQPTMPVQQHAWYLQSGHFANPNFQPGLLFGLPIIQPVSGPTPISAISVTHHQ